VAQFKLATPQESACFVTSARILCVECANTFLLRIAAQRGNKELHLDVLIMAKQVEDNVGF
jgi:hypothetical protein